MLGIFTTDAEALKNRIGCNTMLAEYDLEEWIFGIIELRPEMEVLDLGCGTGKQIEAIKKRAPECKVCGLDISKSAVDELSRRGYPCRLSSFDEPIDGTYDLILSTYAIYYAKSMVETINRFKSNLKKNGRIFLVGPGRGTNQEFIEHMSLPWNIPDFLEENASLNFKSVTRHRLKNKVTFQDRDQLLLWWRNHNSFDQSKMSRLDDLEFPFVLTKNVLGVLLHD